MKKYKDKRYSLFPFFTFLFIASPVLSLQETAEPGAEIVLASLIPILFFRIKYLGLQLKPYHVSAFLMWFMCALVTFFGPFYAEDDVTTLAKYLTYLAFFVVACGYKFSGEDILFIAKSYILLAIVIALLIVLSFLGGYQHLDAEGMLEGKSLYLGRYSIGITGLYKNPNYLSSFICVAALLVLYKMKETLMTFRKRMLYIGITILFFVACFFTGTRASLIVLSISLIGVYGSSLYRHFNLKYILISIILICFIIVLYGKDIENLVDLYLAGREMLGDEGREQAWGKALQFVKENWLWGCGVESWQRLSQGHGALKNLHNVFLDFLLNQGLVGLLLLAYTLLYGVNRAKKADRFFLFMVFLVTAIPLSFQNGVIAVNFWRFIIINRLALNYSIQSKDGIYALFKTNIKPNCAN